MKECIDCQYRGYSPQACAIHLRSGTRRKGFAGASSGAALGLGVRTLVGAGLGVAAIGVGVAALSLGGGAALLHAAIFKITAGAGLVGGALGFFRGLRQREQRPGDRGVDVRGRRMLPPVGGD